VATRDIVAEAAGSDAPRALTTRRTRSDQVYRGISLGAGFLTFLILFLIGLFLLVKAVPALRQQGVSFFTTQVWHPSDVAAQSHFGIASLVVGTVEVALVALVVAIPLSIAAALFITEFAPRRLRRPLTSLVDLLAAIPSIIYGIWGFFFLQNHAIGISRWFADHLGFIPIFRVDRPLFAGSPFMAGLVVSLMVVPITTSVIREVFSQAPPGEKEAALALGGTRWGMIRTVVLPFGKGGIIGGSMLGLGRALGETIAVAIILAPGFVISAHLLESGSANTIAAHIALRFGEPGGAVGLSGLLAAGLALFVLTLVVNTLASVIVARSRSGKGVEI
jgi:phosphate transport system permease protein